METISNQPSRKLKYFFWIILGSLSVFFAEVVSGSDMYPFFHPWGILVVFPLYTLHILVLSYVVFTYGKPRLYTLFLAGAIFGMYEAYITKVLWSPSWGDPIIMVGGVAAIETVVLVLFWHSFMSFIIPLTLAENMLTISREILSGLPEKISQLYDSKRQNHTLFVLFAIVCGMFQSGNSPSLVHSISSGLSTTAVLILMIYLWRNRTQGKEYTIQQLLPNKREFFVLLALLLVMYALMGALLRPEALPGLAPQLLIWLIYAGLFVLLGLSLRKSRKMQLPEKSEPTNAFSWKLIAVLSLLFTVSSATCKMILGDLAMLFLLTGWLFGIVLGVSMLFRSINDLFNMSAGQRQRDT